MSGDGTALVLLVDDDADNLKTLAAILGEKYRVLACGSAREALAALETARPDVVVLDVGLEPVDGRQCLRAIRATPGYGGVPAIAMTADAGRGARDALLATGFQAVVVTPLLDRKELLAAITPLLPAGDDLPGVPGAGPLALPGYEHFSASRDGLTAPTGNGKIRPRGAQPSTPGSV